MSKYVIGVDFGTLSARALVVEVENGYEREAVSMDYAHGVMSDSLPDGTRLGPDWALQHPNDYIECLSYIIPESMRRSGVSPKDVIGLGLDFTSCTLIPLDSSGTPLCIKPEYSKNPHSWVKLWKHHGAQDEAIRMTQVARERGEKWLARCGGKVSSEWMLPKIWEILNDAPEIYDATFSFMEAGDWIVKCLTGNESRNACTAGYKAMWSKSDGYPGPEFLKALDPRLEHIVEEKLSSRVFPIGSCAGEITPEASALTGLLPGTAVSMSTIDAHVSLPPAGFVTPGKLLIIMGTSACHIVLSDSEIEIPGICGIVEDGVVPGLFGYEAGQSCMGDHYKWFVDNCIPASYFSEAKKRNIDIHSLLSEKASALHPGESGLLALDWWNGNRSILVDADLSGIILGLNLATRPEEIYRALIEATAFGTRIIIENFEKYGLGIDSIYACGGIASKNSFLMQLYSDILGREIFVSRSSQAPALGSAMWGTVAAGSKRGGYDSIADAAQHMGGINDKAYIPIDDNVSVYNSLYNEYVTLHNYFGRGENDVMKRLRALREIWHR